MRRFAIHIYKTEQNMFYLYIAVFRLGLHPTNDPNHHMYYMFPSEVYTYALNVVSRFSDVRSYSLNPSTVSSKRAI